MQIICTDAHAQTQNLARDSIATLPTFLCISINYYTSGYKEVGFSWWATWICIRTKRPQNWLTVLDYATL